MEIDRGRYSDRNIIPVGIQQENARERECVTEKVLEIEREIFIAVLMVGAFKEENP